MLPFTPQRHSQVGLAYSGYTGTFLDDHPGVIDFVEVPFELVYYDPRPLEIPDPYPLLLHCSSLSLAGSVPAADQIVDSVALWVGRTKVPWLSEHLAFVTADRPADSGSILDPLPYDVGYSINPPMNMEVVERVVGSVERYERRFGVPLLLENPPIYFVPPGSTMTPSEFARAICDNSSARLLLDLAHLHVSCHNLGLQPVESLHELPIEKIDEVHISGVTQRGGAWWDDHTVAAPGEVHDLLALLLERTSVPAITLEYNWSGNFPIGLLLNEIDRVRSTLAMAGAIT